MQVIKLIYGLLLALFYFPFALAVTLIAYVLSPVLPLFAKDGWLPSWLSWFQTPDASINGDSGWTDAAKHPWINSLPVYFRQVFWLIRNPSYGFNSTVLATDVLPDEGYVTFGRLDISDKGVWGLNFAYIKTTPYFVIRAYFPTLFGKCMKFRFGWNIATPLMNNNYQGTVIKYVTTFNPFKSINK